MIDRQISVLKQEFQQASDTMLDAPTEKDFFLEQAHAFLQTMNKAHYISLMKGFHRPFGGVKLIKDPKNQVLMRPETKIEHGPIQRLLIDSIKPKRKKEYKNLLAEQSHRMPEKSKDQQVRSSMDLHQYEQVQRIPRNMQSSLVETP